MMLQKASLAQRVFVPVLGLFVVFTLALGYIQYTVYVRGFEHTLDRVEDSSLEVQRAATRGQLDSVFLATERMLQTNENEQFTRYATRQREQSGMEELSFATADGKVALGAPPACVGTSVPAGVLQQAAEATDVIVLEDGASLALYRPLRVDRDMRRLRPELEVGQLYGLLHVRCSKDRINSMLAAASGEFQGAVRSALTWSAAAGGASLFVMAGAVLLLVVRPLSRALGGIIRTLGERADELVGLAGQLAGSSRQLAGTSSEQASCLEETSSALVELSATSKANAERSEQADGLAGQARQSATRGSEVMNRLDHAMGGINTASAEIRKITKAIEEIAFQTNLLALNAAVEAASAGEHGKGFAVVAEEVRSLAQRAGQAAGQTTQLIEQSVERVRDGMKVASEVGSSLGEILTGSTQVSELVSGITAASREQAEGAEQITQAVSQMDNVTQQNAAAAEETASAAHELTANAENVQRAVNELVAVVAGARAAQRNIARAPEPPAPPTERQTCSAAASKPARSAASPGTAPRGRTPAAGTSFDNRPPQATARPPSARAGSPPPAADDLNDF